MPKVTIVQVVYNSRKFISPVFSAIFNQTFQNFNVVAVIAGNDDGGKELLMQKFPQVEVIDPGYNIGFAKGHNLVFEKYANLSLTLPKLGEGNHNEKSTEFFQLVNPDMIMEPNYIEEMLKAFEDEKVGAATGKLLRFDFDKNQKTNIIDTTGVVISKSGRARDRGQHEVDNGQFDNLTSVQAVSAAGAMYRRSALQATSYKLQASKEFFDEDFHSYWEDVDLTWRMSNAGFKCVFIPSAVGYHARGAGSSAGGYKDIVGFIKHHRALSPRVRQLNYQNHIFMYIKNSKWFYPQFFVRELFMFLYILFFEIGTLKILPKMLKLLSKMFAKRREINTNIERGRV